MRAEDLIGVPAIRRKAVIISEENKIADTDYMDPSKPVIIKKYNYENHNIVLVTHSGIETILDKSYDDDSWISVKMNKPKDITIPAGYKQLPILMRSIMKAKELGKLRGANPEHLYAAVERNSDMYKDVSGEVYHPSNIQECVQLIRKAFTGRDSITVGFNCSNYRFYRDDQPTIVHAEYRIGFIRNDKVIDNTYYLVHPKSRTKAATTKDVDIVIEECEDFGNAMECITDECDDKGAAILTLDWIEVALNCYFGLEAIRYANYMNTISNSALVLTLFGTYKANIHNATVDIYLPDAEEIAKIYFSNDPIPPTIMLQYEESIKLRDLVNNTKNGVYTCMYKDIM